MLRPKICVGSILWPILRRTVKTKGIKIMTVDINFAHTDTGATVSGGPSVVVDDGNSDARVLCLLDEPLHISVVRKSFVAVGGHAGDIVN